MNLGAFLVVMVVANATGREDIDGFRGLAWRGGAVPAVAMAIFLFSLAGLPPLAGFIGKFYLFAAVIQRAVLRPRAGRRAQQRRLALLLRAHRAHDVPRLPGRRRGRRDASTRTTARCSCVLAAATVVLGVYWAPVIALADRSVQFFTG